MDSILPALLAVTVLVLASMSLGQSSFNSFQALGDSWQEAEERSIDRLQSDISITSVTVAGPLAEVVIRNDGETPIVDFSRMDVVVQYTSGDIVSGFGNNMVYVPYSDVSPLPDNTWTALVITDDVIDPGVLNNGESLTIQARLNPAVGTPTSNWVQVSTELGVSASSFFTN
jgi:hypothetical protein